MRNVNTRYAVAVFVILVAFSNSCKKVPGDLPPITPASTLPSFATHKNEIEIADSMNDVDPTWVLGSIVVIATGEVHGFDNYLSPTAKPTVTPQNEIVFKKFIENSLVVDASWLDFLGGKVSNDVKAEVSVIKTSKVTMKNADVNSTQLRRDFMKDADRSRYGVIIGYVDFVLSAGLYRNIGVGAHGGGYGVKIGANWFSKSEDTSVQHRTIAVWSPLPFVLDQVREAPGENLEAATQKALPTLGTRKIAGKPSFKAYIQKLESTRLPMMKKTPLGKLPN